MFASHIFQFDKVMMNQDDFQLIVESLLTLGQSLYNQQIHTYISAFIYVYYNTLMTYVTFAFSTSLVYSMYLAGKTALEYMRRLFYYLYIFPFDYAWQHICWIWQDTQQGLKKVYSIVFTRAIPDEEVLMVANTN